MSAVGDLGAVPFGTPLALMGHLSFQKVTYPPVCVGSGVWPTTLMSQNVKDTESL